MILEVESEFYIFVNYEILNFLILLFVIYLKVLNF